MTRVLFLSIVDPSIQKGGAWTITRTLIGLLKEGPLKAEVEVLACPDFTGVGRRRRQASAIIRSLVSPLPAKIEFTRTHWMLAKLRQLLAARTFDLILLNGTDLLWLLPHLPPGVPRVLIAHNIENELFGSQTASRIFSLPLIRSIVNWEWRRLRDYEIEALRQIGRVIFISTADESYARAQCPGLETITVPPLFADPPTRKPCPAAADSQRLEIGMLANFDWWPNRQGVSWFLSDVFPHAPGSLLHLFGSGSESVVSRHPRIVAHGFVKDLMEVWTTCNFMICPRISGAGVSVKFAEALYHGMPVLATTKAARGLPLDPNPAIALLDTARDWIQFLHKDAASFGKQCIPASLSNRFAASNYTQALSTFLIIT
jgi:glycosyltransferase involved in cell wall biosynthesis